MKKEISIQSKMEAELGLLSKYAEDNTQKINKIIDGFKEDSIEKYAGIFIDNPTQENIEDFIRKYVYNELSFFPRILEVFVNFIPDTYDKSKRGNVDTGSGVVSIDVRGKKLELPFMITDGQLNPFDVIQLDGTRCPYSRDNFQKVIINLDRQRAEEQGDATNLSVQPYKDLADFSNPSTVPGFLGDVLSVRDAQASRRGNGTFVVASSEYTDMEKLAYFGTTHLDYSLDDFKKPKETKSMSEKVATEIKEMKPMPTMKDLLKKAMMEIK